MPDKTSASRTGDEQRLYVLPERSGATVPDRGAAAVRDGEPRSRGDLRSEWPVFELVEHFHKRFARPQNALRGRWESFQASEPVCVVKLVGGDQPRRDSPGSNAYAAEHRAIRRARSARNAMRDEPWPGVGSCGCQPSARLMKRCWDDYRRWNSYGCRDAGPGHRL